MSKTAPCLTGFWNGQFTYPRILNPEHFTASLFEADGLLGGSITERASSGTAGGLRFLSSVHGKRDGFAVRFTKTYESGSRQHAVIYTGMLSGDGAEIEGRWHIPGSWSGKFLMIRNSGVSAESVTETEELIQARF
ncbi:hypothetical protein [Acetobacter oeni]|uniref:DUF1579 domain-containing protein n=1 Tax=Acetobacter oeni TaxID=304077 RepID=A0A511XIH4_9PROT|nr:hypothetical protein [Acetobacter oeni]MBB3881457.1 hypothetical protein [Acetobacter oeni]NHO18322.1 hypothetical protein [Acetobacter oeni]GBR10930.1 hypothetical protein AA21952_3213 [Acetobacter oeni LMG 21952]GEN62734.1 hypothetical protein AOE01nite_09580 [Acetobacter oeni]